MSAYFWNQYTLSLFLLESPSHTKSTYWTHEGLKCDSYFLSTKLTSRTFDVHTNYNIVDFIFNEFLNEKVLLQLKIDANKTNRK